MSVIMTDEPDVQLTPYCLCGAGPDDGHWSICPAHTGDFDPGTDDADDWAIADRMRYDRG